MQIKNKSIWVLAILSSLALILAACAPATPVITQPTIPFVTQEAIPQTGLVTTTPEINLTNLIEVHNQALGANNSVVISRVRSLDPGWVVVYTQGPGEVGQPIGHAYVPNGVSTHVQVPIDVSQATSTLIVRLHNDAGQQGVFEYPGVDAPVLVNNQALSATFQVSGLPGGGVTPVLPSVPLVTTTPAAPTANQNVNPTAVPVNPPGVSGPTANITNLIQASDQAIQNNTVTISQVTSTGPGWVAIHALPQTPAEYYNYGPVIGYAQLQDGQNQNVQVQIDSSRATNLLRAVLHTDAAPVGTFNFPGQDAIVFSNGSPVAQEFRVTSGSVSGAGPSAGAAASQAATVAITASQYTPETLNVAQGATVTWTNNSNQTETVTAVNGAFDSGDLAPGKSFSYTFNQPGQFTFFSLYGSNTSATNFTGTVNVAQPSNP